MSYTHGREIDEIGYHCRDYFVNQWERFGGYHGGVLAHSTHVKGCGTFDAATGIESPRIQVTLATGITPERCARLNLGYLDPASHPDPRVGGARGRGHPGGAPRGRDVVPAGVLSAAALASATA